MLILLFIGISRGGVEGVVTAFIAICGLGGSLFFCYKRANSCFLQIGDRNIDYETLTGKSYSFSIDDDIELITSSGWIGIRRKENPDLVIDKEEFKDSEWEMAVEEFKSMQRDIPSK